jgi:PKD repeat protein
MVEAVDTLMRKLLAFVSLLFAFSIPSVCRAEWFDSNWTCRRSLQVVWDEQNASGNDLGSCLFYTDGHALPNGEDVRVTTAEGKLCASHVLMVGPGDRIRVVFALVKGERNYDIYFGNPTPAAPPEGMDDVKYKSGLLLETRVWTGGQINSFQTMEKSWNRSKPVLGKMMTDAVFLGYNPFGPQEQWISKFTGSLFAPVEGDYLFAAAADDAGALYIDGKPIVFAPLGGGDIRYHNTIHLDRGSHDFLVYHVNFAGNAYISVGWKRPDMPKVAVINREAFGLCPSGLAGPLEIHNKTLVADFGINQMGECFFDDSYSFHYKFTAKASLANANKFQWSFGDGQTSTKAEVDHVYLTDGIYPVRLTATFDGNSDTQTCQLAVSRNYAHILESREVQPKILSGIVKDYDLNTIPPAAYSRIVQLDLAAEEPSSAIGIADKLAAMPTHTDAAVTTTALTALCKALIDSNKSEQAIEIWDRVPTHSDLQPYAARHAAELALWWTGDFTKAVKLLQPYAGNTDAGLQRQYAQALVLSGKSDEARKILEKEMSSVSANRKAALSGAAARSVEFFITNKDVESGEEAWDKWQARFPTDFLEGYSVVLRTKLMELRKRPDAAAKVAEAFAAAMPQSPYAPQLLDRASKLLAATDPPKSQVLRQLLKQKYPEDPLSQD